MNETFFNPSSIAIVGASENTSKPGGSILKNLLDGRFKGNLYPVNPSHQQLMGIECYQELDALPPIDLAIIALKAEACVPTVSYLAEHKSTRSFIIISAGFGESGDKGKCIEKELIQLAKDKDLFVLGPNCIGALTSSYSGVFTQPVPAFHPKGVELISSSGATAVFIMEAGLQMGMPFSNTFSTGNARVIGIEDLLHPDRFSEDESHKVIALYIENLTNPKLFIEYAFALKEKNIHIVALKSGVSSMGQVAASSHTGAIATPDIAIDALFKKAGVIRAHSKTELLCQSGVLCHRPLKGNKLAIITHAGGPGVILSDELVKGGFQCPELSKSMQKELLDQLHPGASAHNPIDILATGTAKHIAIALDSCLSSGQYDGIIVILGSPGLFDESEMFEEISKRIESASIPIYPVFPSPINCKRELITWKNKGIVYFHDEAQLARALAKVYPSKSQATSHKTNSKKPDQLIKLNWLASTELAIKFDLPLVQNKMIHNEEELRDIREVHFPMVLKSDTIEHRMGKGGVELNINNLGEAEQAFRRLKVHFPMEDVIAQPQCTGFELFAGIKYEEGYGHLLFAGTGGIWVEIVKDIQYRLAPIGNDEAMEMISQLACYPILKGYRKQFNNQVSNIARLMVNLSEMTQADKNIFEADFNPIILGKENINIVDMKIILKKR